MAVDQMGILDEGMLIYVHGLISKKGLYATKLATKFSFRNRFEHCLRVAKIAVELAREENRNEEVAAICGLFHDAGKSAGKNHGLVGAKLCKKYLLKHSIQLENLDKIIYCIENHSNKSIPQKGCPYYKDLKILQDADLLDEVGAMGISWTLLGQGPKKPKSYAEVLTNLQTFHTKENGKKLINKMYTKTAKTMMKERIAFEKKFIHQLEKELLITD